MAVATNGITEQIWPRSFFIALISVNSVYIALLRLSYIIVFCSCGKDVELCAKKCRFADFAPFLFFVEEIHALPDRWAKCVASDGKYFE